MTTYQDELVSLLSKIRDGLLELAEDCGKALEELRPIEPPAEPDPEALARLPWRSFKTRLEAASEEAAWTFTSDPDGRVKPEVEPLLKALNRSQNQRVTIGPFEYRLSGEGRFIQRRPLR
ncbi:MAG: hypothetical protein QXH67_02715 [Candidatus Bathyarchaeia archaeon]